MLPLASETLHGMLVLKLTVSTRGKMILLSAKCDTFLCHFPELRKGVLEQHQLAGLGFAAGEMQYGSGKGAYALTEVFLPPELAAMAQCRGGGCLEPS